MDALKAQGAAAENGNQLPGQGTAPQRPPQERQWHRLVLDQTRQQLVAGPGSSFQQAFAG
ncbi:hypothetical protein HRbin36_02090 [bacterium HR36]|nr:hypothetical protein HRbin36_02090 [bacterium HR36]